MTQPKWLMGEMQVDWNCREKEHMGVFNGLKGFSNEIEDGKQKLQGIEEQIILLEYEATPWVGNDEWGLGMKM